MKDNSIIIINKLNINTEEVIVFFIWSPGFGGVKVAKLRTLIVPICGHLFFWKIVRPIIRLNLLLINLNIFYKKFNTIYSIN
jgi:hypothetical protein